MTTVTGTTSGTSGIPMASGPAGAMGQADFLRLMTTQLTTQDPFNPLDNNQMVAQMAQFSQVAGIAEINASVKSLVDALATPGRLTDAASWIGRSVLVETDVAAPDNNGRYAGEIGLPEGAEHVAVNYVDAGGTIVHSQHFGPRNAGPLSFAWDGRNEAGEQVATGPLKIEVSASVRGVAIKPPLATWTTVTGIQSPARGGATMLLTGIGAVPPDDALRLA